MATNSYPAVGTGGFTDAQWATMLGSRDGIIEDYTGDACALTRNNATDMCTVQPGKVSVNGYVLDITAAHDLYCAPVTGAAVQYYIVAKYDPALNVADGDGTRSDLGPCRLLITTSTPSTAGEGYVTLYRITRSPSQVLSAAQLEDVRKWIGPSVEQVTYSTIGLSTYPRGTRLLITGTNEDWIRTTNGAGGLTWKSVNTAPVAALPTPGSLVAYGQPAQMFKFSGGMVGLQGTLTRSSGANLSTGADVILGTLPAGYRPGGTRNFIVRISGGTAGYQAGNVRIGTDGVITMTDPPATAVWIDLSGIVFRAEN